MRHSDRAFPPLGADFMNLKEIIALLMSLIAGLSLCDGAFDWFLYFGGLLWARLAGLWSEES